MGEICGLKFHLIYVDASQKRIIEISPCAKKVIFITEFAILCKNPPFYEVKKYFPKKALCMEEFQNKFSRPLFTIIFKPKILSLESFTWSKWNMYLNFRYIFHFDQVNDG